MNSELKQEQLNIELLQNTGFEEPLGDQWTAVDCIIQRDNSQKLSGNYSLLVTNRQSRYASPQLDITEQLRKSGQGVYSFGASLMIPEGEKPITMYMSINIESTEQSAQEYISKLKGINSNEFTRCSADNKKITWQGELTRAYINFPDFDTVKHSGVYIDELSLVKTDYVTPAPQYTSIKQTIEKRGGNLPAVGAIRWDAWLPKPNSVGSAVARALGPNKYHFRLPYFSIINGEDVDFPEPSQEIMDQEINFATEAGIDFWAYCWYATGSSMDAARDLHISSSIRDNVKMCAIVFTDNFTDAERKKLVSYFKESFYMRVQERPLLFFFNNDSALYTISFIQQDCKEMGVPMPYCVSMAGMTTGMDAVTKYSVRGTDGNPFSTLAKKTEKVWEAQKETGQVLPMVSSGWDPRPRIDNPVPWSNGSLTTWAQTAAAEEMAEHFKNSLKWVSDNVDATLPNTVLFYAWNEHDEGGWLCPTLSVDDNGEPIMNEEGTVKINNRRLEAIKDVIMTYNTEIKNN